MGYKPRNKSKASKDHRNKVQTLEIKYKAFRYHRNKMQTLKI